jgi:2,3-bisphosphoglycerate-independent phosphoglycerate mutase
MAGHSWHPVPVLLWSEHCFVDDCTRLTEKQALHGHLGTVRSMELMGLMLANAGRLEKFGA